MRLNLRFVRRLGIKGRLCPRTWIWKISPVDEARKPGMASQVVKPNPPLSHQPAQVFDVDLSTPVETTPSQTPPSKFTVSTSSQPSQKFSSNIIENEDLAWERFKNAVTNEDINTCYDMSLKDFEHSGVHDLFKVTSLPRFY